MTKKLITLVLIIVCVAGTAAGAKKSRKSPSPSSSVRPTRVYTLSGCESCAALKRRLRNAGVSMRVRHTDERYYEYYPTVIYSNQTSDNGERIYARRCSFPDSLLIVETD